METVSEEASLNGVPTVKEVLMPPFHASAISLCCPLCTKVCLLLRLPTMDPVDVYVVEASVFTIILFCVTAKMLIHYIQCK